MFKLHINKPKLTNYMISIVLSNYQIDTFPNYSTQDL